MSGVMACTLWYPHGVRPVFMQRSCEPASAAKIWQCLLRVAPESSYSRHHSCLNSLNNLGTCVKPAISNPGVVQLSVFCSPVQYFFSTSNYDSVKNNISEYVPAHCSGHFSPCINYMQKKTTKLPKTWKDLSLDPKAFALNPPCKMIHNEREEVSGI